MWLRVAVPPVSQMPPIPLTSPLTSVRRGPLSTRLPAGSTRTSLAPARLVRAVAGPLGSPPARTSIQPAASRASTASSPLRSHGTLVHLDPTRHRGHSGGVDQEEHVPAGRGVIGVGWGGHAERAAAAGEGAVHVALVEVV